MFLPVIRHTRSQVRWGLRSYLTEAHKAQQMWDDRLSSKIFSNIKLEDFYFEMDRKFNREKRGSHVDIDIFANAVTNSSQIDPLEDLLHRFRRTPQSFKTLPSTHHAVVRAYLKLEKTDELLKILNDRLNFGLFLDTYASILLLNHFLVNKNYRDGTKVASHLMLQEEIDPEFSLPRSMGAYATLQYALTDIKHQDTLPWDPLPYPEKVEPEEEVKIRVEYLDPVYHDNHFDMNKVEDIVGKTLIFLGKQSQNEVSRDSLISLGHALRGEALPTPIGPVSNTIAERLKELMDEDSYSKLQFDPLDIAQDLNQCIIKDLESFNMESKLQDLYTKWNGIRESELKKQYDSYMKEHRLSEIERKRKLLKEKEETLFFFDNFQKMEMQQEEKILEWRKKLPRKMDKPIKLKPKQNVSQDYKPPKII